MMKNLTSDVKLCSSRIKQGTLYQYRVGEEITTESWDSPQTVTYVGYGCVSGIGEDSGTIRVAPVIRGTEYFLRRALAPVEVQMVREELFRQYGPDYAQEQKTVEGALDMESYDV